MEGINIGLAVFHSFRSIYGCLSTTVIIHIAVWILAQSASQSVAAC